MTVADELDCNSECSLKDKYKLLLSVLNSKEEESKAKESLKNFVSILENDFLKDFTIEENTMTQDAKVFSELKQLEHKLTYIVKFPMITTKSIVAVAGGFSSGKSKFLNTIIKGGGIRLSVGITPITAIPTFLLMDKESKVTVYTPDGKQGNIDIELFNKLNHNFIESLDINLKNIMPYVSVKTPFSDKYIGLDNICIIDTPGYDPCGTEYTENDKNVTLDVLRYASSILWFIDIDNGTLKNSDIEFLHQAISENEKIEIYIIVSKADKKKSSIDMVMQEIQDKFNENFDVNKINLLGISAYSSNTEVEYKAQGKVNSIVDFLKKQNSNVTNTASQIIEYKRIIDKIFDKYSESISENTKELQEKRKKLTEIQISYERQIEEIKKENSSLSRSLRMNSYSFRDYGTKKSFHNTKSTEFEEIDFTILSQGYDKQLKKNEENKKKTLKICREMKSAIDDIFNTLSPEAVKKSQYSKFCKICGASIKTINIKYCTKCGCKISI